KNYWFTHSSSFPRRG
ncbi:GTPase Der, partial [Haemophilus influenzae]